MENLITVVWKGPGGTKWNTEGPFTTRRLADMYIELSRDKNPDFIYGTIEGPVVIAESETETNKRLGKF